jgi:hypothetical protein
MPRGGIKIENWKGLFLSSVPGSAILCVSTVKITSSENKDKICVFMAVKIIYRTTEELHRVAKMKNSQQKKSLPNLEGYLNNLIISY